MKCEKCGFEFNPAYMAKMSDPNGEAAQVVAACPNCGDAYYAFTPDKWSREAAAQGIIAAQQAEQAKSEQAKFKVGDKVTWTHSTSNGSSYRFSTREGTIVSMNNVVAECKMRNGRKSWVEIDKLTPEGQPTALTQAFLGDAS